jgi:hypothetical protein
LICAVLGLALIEVVWRTDLAPQISWDATGVTIVRPRGVDHAQWREVRSIDFYGSSVHIETRNAHLAIGADAAGSIGETLGRGRRTGEQLEAALRRARTAALAQSAAAAAATPEFVPESVSRPQRPLLPYVLWIFAVLLSGVPLILDALLD